MKKRFIFLVVTIFLFGAVHAQTRGSDSPMFYATPTGGSNPGLFKTTVGDPGGGVKLTGVGNSAWRSIEWFDDGSEDGVIYAITWTSGVNRLGTVDQNTGAFNFIANTVDAMGLAVNPLTSIFYATVAVGLGHDFGTLNIETGEFTRISTMPALFVMYTIAIDNDGICYAISNGSTELGVIDLTTGTYTATGSLGIYPANDQNLSIDRETNELYWASRTNSSGRNFYKVDKSSGALTNLGQCAQDYQAFCIVGSGASPASPAPVSNLTVTPGASGALTATINWTNPSLNLGGETLTELTATEVYENDGTTPIYTNSAPVIGGNDSYTATVTVAGFYVYTVTSENSEGKNTLSSETVWIGEDVPAAPGNVQLTANNMEAQLAWTAPLEGLNGGYLPATGLVYDVYRMPENELVSENQTEETFTEIITQSGTYFYRVVAKNAVGEGGAATSNDVSITIFVTAELVAITAPRAGYNTNLSATEPVKVIVKNNGDDPLTGFELQLKLNDTEIATEVYTGSILGLEEAEYTFTATLDLSAEGEYVVTVTVIAMGDVAPEIDSKTISVLNIVGGLTNFPLVEGFEDFDFPPAGWTVYNVNGGEAFWDIRYVFAHSGDASACHVGGSPMQEGWLITPAIRLPDNMESLLEFWSYNGSPEDNYHNGIWISTTDMSVESFTLVKQLTGLAEISASWKKIGVSLGDYAGNNVYLGFKYMGNNADIWVIDDVSVKLAGIDGAVTKLSGAVAPMEGEPFAYKATIENLGNQLLTGYSVTLINSVNNNVLAVCETGADIAPGETGHVNIIWTAQTAGTIFLRAILNMPGDVDPTNDVSPVLEVNVEPNTGNLFEGPIGTDRSMSMMVPVNFYYKSSRAQSLFFDHEIMGRSGKIIQIQYFNNFVNEVGIKPIQVWMANTTRSSLNTWLPESEFTLVFSGEVHFPIGQNTITIPLDIPYEYAGNNLVIMTNRPMDTEEYSMNDVFYCTRTPDVTHRSRSYNSDTQEFNWTQPGTSANWHPNIVLSIALEDLGSISGTVTDGTTPLGGVRVEIVGTNQNRITNAEGNYNFNMALPGTHQIKAEKFGYANTTSPVTVVSNSNTTVDLVLTPLSIYTVSGKVTGTGASEGLENVIIKLTGYSDYTVVTNAAGNYLIPDVYDGFTYHIEAKLSGYEIYTSTVVVNANVTHNIELIEIPYPVLRPVAEEVGDVAVVRWGAPQEMVTFRYDNGICTGQLGFNIEAAPNGVMGACHRENAELHKMSWYLTDNAGEHTEVNLFIFELSATGQPTNNLIFSARHVPTFVSRWSEYVFPEPVSTPNGFFMAMSHETSFLSLGTAAPDTDYPFLPGTSFISSDYTQGEFFTLEGQGFQLNFMLRAEGYALGKAAQFGYPATTAHQSKSIVSYAVYRLREGDSEALWTELSTNVTTFNYTDNEWSTLPEAAYQYAVKAIYTGNIMSEARLSNVLRKMGVKENDLSNIEIYSHLNKVYIKNKTNVALKAVEILDVMGRVVHRSVINDTETVISLQTATGIYVVRLISQDHAITTKKVSIQKL